MQLRGKTVFITGGGRGIGKASALEFAKSGAQVVVAARTLSETSAVAAEIESAGGTALAVPIDVRSTESVDQAFEQAFSKFGVVDILVNNAGIARSAPFSKTSEEFWLEIQDINLNGAFRCIKAAIPKMFGQKWGRIINIASIAGKAGAPYISAYVASKHGLLGLTRALAQEVATVGITVNAICPGYVETDMAALAIKNIVEKTKVSPEQARTTLGDMNPQKRLFQVDEVAGLILYLATDTARGINGQAINICGGALPY